MAHCKSYNIINKNKKLTRKIKTTPGELGQLKERFNLKITYLWHLDLITLLEMLSESLNKVFGRNVFYSDTVVAVDAGKLNLKNTSQSETLYYPALFITFYSQFQRLGAVYESESEEYDEH